MFVYLHLQFMMTTALCEENWNKISQLSFQITTYQELLKILCAFEVTEADVHHQFHSVRLFAENLKSWKDIISCNSVQLTFLHILSKYENHYEKWKKNQLNFLLASTPDGLLANHRSEKKKKFISDCLDCKILNCHYYFAVAYTLLLRWCLLHDESYVKERLNFVLSHIQHFKFVESTHVIDQSYCTPRLISSPPPKYLPGFNPCPPGCTLTWRLQ